MAPRTGLFVYGFIRATEARGTAIPGVEHAGLRSEVTVITVGGIGAVVSDASVRDKVMPTRKNLDTHSRVIREFVALGAIIPMSFGQIVKNTAALEKFMKANTSAISKELDRLDGKVEMSLRVRWDVENIFEYFVAEDRELAEARDRIFSQSGTPSHAEKMELGRLFEEHLTEERSKHTENVLSHVRTTAKDIKVNTPKGEKTVMELVLLVDRQKIGQFEERVNEVAGLFPNQYTFDFNGPWAPFSFVQLELSSPA
jgi:hypothetical protein